MDAWNAAKLILDISFGVVVTLSIVTFLYMREKKIRRLVADYVAAQAQLAVEEEYNESASPAASITPTAKAQPRPETNIRPIHESSAFVRGSSAAKPLVARYQVGGSTAGSDRELNASSSKMRKPAAMSRTEKYLEAVRMYRDGRGRDEIENNLGISFMELELLGQLK